METRLSNLLLILFCLVATSTMAQTADKSNVEEKVQFETDSISKEILNTEESLKYIGSELFFELKQRLHLTDESAERREKRKNKSAKFSIFGITIERNN